MAKPRKNSTAAAAVANSNSAAAGNVGVRVKPKRTRKSVPRESPSQRSSVYRGVTRHRWTGRFEAHLWDKNSWNESQNKKGKQGAYDDEDAAARAYDLAALKYWGPDTILNFPASAYEEELKEMEGQSREEYIGSLRRPMKFIHRKSSGFSRGVSKYRGVARHHHNGRWEARIGRVFGNKYLYLGTYATQEEAAMAYDMAAIEYRGLNAVTNFDLSRYIKWLRPGANGVAAAAAQNPHPMLGGLAQEMHVDLDSAAFQHEHHRNQSAEAHFPVPPRTSVGHTPTTSALSLLLQSPKFKEMIARTTAAESSTTSSSPPPTPSPPRPSPSQELQVQAAKDGGVASPQSFPDDIQTFFGCEDVAGVGVGVGYTDVDGLFFGDLAAYASPAFHFELDL
ncbi:hypothetical protein EJB05_43056 [Eragrostis curvula]|uniref:AP2/ERF domain-containing protein n=1 Tax=Eragrostis curvula TaxID=38414 RepID=A0A5J9TE58_9POAL|nr:hypothetical protein EJB05_43056 [Eragrostis curvula]